MKTLLALAVITAGSLGDGSAEVPIGATFEASDAVADQLISTGNAKLFVEVPNKKTVKVRVLINCAFGNANDVVALSQAEAQSAQDGGFGDCNPEAVAYAESLAKTEV